MLLAKKFRSEYATWGSLRSRCSNPKDKAYANYGGRGITVCPRWSRFKFFLEDMGMRPTPKHTLERVDNNKGYEPSNCTWATREEQNNNRRNVRIVVLDGVQMPLSRAVKLRGSATLRVVRARLNKGWPLDRALSLPKFEGKLLREARQRGAQITALKRFGASI